MLQLNYRDPRPIYTQIVSEYKRLILSGALVRGEKLPSVRDLAGQLAINPNTIQRAYRELETDGFIVSMPPILGGKRSSTQNTRFTPQRNRCCRSAIPATRWTRSGRKSERS